MSWQKCKAPFGAILANTKYATDGLYTQNTDSEIQLFNVLSALLWLFNNTAGGPALAELWDVKIEEWIFGFLSVGGPLCALITWTFKKSDPTLVMSFPSLLDQCYIRMWETMKGFFCVQKFPIQSYQPHPLSKLITDPFSTWQLDTRHKSAFVGLFVHVYVCVFHFCAA